MAMALRSQPTSAVTLSLLDRLTDVEPRNNSLEAPLSRAESVRIFKAGVRRDLEWLLNTRKGPEDLSDSPEVESSILGYGLPDFSTFGLASPKEQARLVRVLQEVVSRFEPRLSNVKVVPVEITSTGTRAIRLRLEGLLLMDPAPELISFDTTLRLTTGDFFVREEN